jgi:hypothetical protein
MVEIIVVGLAVAGLIGLVEWWKGPDIPRA